MEKIVICWSGGKDSAMALHELRRTGRYEIVAALTTVSQEFDRICIHGVRRSLLKRQTEALGLNLHEIFLGKDPSNEEYQERLDSALMVYKAQGIDRIAFGDLFLEDIRAYRDKTLRCLGMEGIYPLWKRPTAALAREMIACGIQTVLTCVDTETLSADFAGRDFDESLLRDLPVNIDPCGENGEFHTFVWDGPGFRTPVPIQKGGKVIRERFAYQDFVGSLT